LPSTALSNWFFYDGHYVNLHSERNFNYTHYAVYRIEGAIIATFLGNAFKHCNQMVISSDSFNRLVSVDLLETASSAGQIPK
jgi:hypothetical protein